MRRANYLPQHPPPTSPHPLHPPHPPPPINPQHPPPSVNLVIAVKLKDKVNLIIK